MKLIQTLIASSCIFSIISCSTVEGMGKDLQSLGKAIEKTAEPSTTVKPVDKKPVEQPTGEIVTPIK